MSEQAEIQFRLNGKQFKWGLVLQAVAVTVIVAVLIGSLRWSIEIRDFLKAGDRFTGAEGRDLTRRLDIHVARVATYREFLEVSMIDRREEQVHDREVGREEDRRLQQQIDRLEAAVFVGVIKPPLRPYAE
jgi:hypothetical protein